MNEVLLPRTDDGVAFQVVVVIVLTVVAPLLLRRERSLVFLVVGVGMLRLGAMGLRAPH